MKLCWILIAGVVAAGISAPAQTQEELPSAPSATLEELRPKPKPTPAPTPEATPVPVPTPPPAAAAASEGSGTSRAGESASTGSKDSANPNSDNNAGTEGSEFRFKSRVDEVNVVFTVTDKHGAFVRDLAKTDFSVLDDNQPPKEVVAFNQQTNLPLRVGLLVDASNSIRDRFKFEQEAAIEFLSQIVRPKSDRAFVVGFDTTAEITADFTDDNEKLARGVRLLKPGGGTALYDAIFFASRDKLMKAPQTGPVRRAIVILSDGDDNQSRVTREEAIEMAQRAEVVIYAISTNASGYKDRGDKVLERMTEATGGRAFFPFKIEDVGNAFTEIQDELRSQYSVSYRPASLQADGKYHSIEIVAQNHKNLRVRSRKGYFAPKQ